MGMYGVVWPWSDRFLLFLLIAQVPRRRPRLAFLRGRGKNLHELNVLTWLFLGGVVMALVEVNVLTSIPWRCGDGTGCRAP